MRAVLVSLACQALLAFAAHAGTFSNSYLEFLLPAFWFCELDETDYICQHRLPDGVPTDAIIILTAKIANVDDGLAPYIRHLSQDLSESESHSLLKSPTTIQIQQQFWVSALHSGSELPGYQTRYLATVVNGLAILATFTAHQKSYTDHEDSFMQAIYSLNVKENWRANVAN